MAVFEEAISSLSKENYVEEVERIWNKIGETHNRRKISRQAFNVNITTYFSTIKITFSNSKNTSILSNVIFF